MSNSSESVFNQKFDTESDLINIKNYFEQYVKVIPSSQEMKKKVNDNSNETAVEHDDCEFNEFYKSVLGVSDEQLTELKSRISIDHLSFEGETDFYEKYTEGKFPLKIPENDSPLISVKRQEESIRLEQNEFTRNFYKYCGYEWPEENEKERTIISDVSKLNDSTIVAVVKIYQPFFSSSPFLKIKLLHEIHILGNQTLAQLKDKISCYLDYIGDKDLSNDILLKDVGHNITAKEEYPSSFIFIEDTFYIDSRNPKSTDLSRELRAWALEKKIREFKTGIMENTKIIDLNVRVGSPYVYLHQGNCEHILMFSDIRLIDAHDSKNLNDFPKIHCNSSAYGRHCMMCSNFYARWIVVGSERLTHDKAYLCQKCFISYNYIAGKKIGNFQAFKYVDPVAIL